jgi:hypothetical protein
VRCVDLHHDRSGHRGGYLADSSGGLADTEAHPLRIPNACPGPLALRGEGGAETRPTKGRGVITSQEEPPVRENIKARPGS